MDPAVSVAISVAWTGLPRPEEGCARHAHVPAHGRHRAAQAPGSGKRRNQGAPPWARNNLAARGAGCRSRRAPGLAHVGTRQPGSAKRPADTRIGPVLLAASMGAATLYGSHLRAEELIARLAGTVPPR